MENTSLAIADPIKLVPAQHEMQVFYTMAEAAVESKFYKHLGDKSAVMMIMLAARELNIPPMMALNKGIQNIQGNLEISARLMNALMRRSGISIQTIESTALKCTLKGTRPNGDTETVSYSVADAQVAGLVKAGGGWTKNPTDMCYSRAISRLARRLAPDVIGGCYVEGEISDSGGTKGICSEPMEEVKPRPMVADWMVAYLKLFSSEERVDAARYMDAFKDHFAITVDAACEEMLKEPEKTKQKFYAWLKNNPS